MTGIPRSTAGEFDALQRTLAGRYSVERELGRGGMGVVFLARDVALDRPVAIKVLTGAAADDRLRERFLREARTAAGLSHPNIVPVHAVEEHGGSVCFVMAYVQGETLGERVRRAGPLPVADAARITEEVAQALAYAHGRGVVHRDIKPDNILLERGSNRALVTDFGIARVATAGALTTDGEIVGTAQFMAPEQADPGAVLDGRTDLYALGATAFFTLTGRLPFESDSVHALLAMHLTQPAPPVASLRAEVPAALALAVDRCLAKRPDERFGSAEELARAVGGAVGRGRLVPESIRRFQNTLTATTAQLGVVTLLAMFASDFFDPAAVPQLGLLLILLGSVPILQLFLAGRTVVRAGWTPHDVAAAFLSDELPDAAGQAEREQLRKLRDLLHLSSPESRVQRVLAWTLSAVSATASLFTILADEPNPLATLVFGVSAAFFGWLALAHRHLVRLRAESGTTDEGRLILHRLFGGQLGLRFFDMVGLGLPRRAQPLAIPAPAPTEVVVGRAAEALWDGLPSSQRKMLPAVPEALRALERAAAALRARKNEIARLQAEAAGSADPKAADVVTELAETSRRLDRRLALTVAALEHLRLDLIRLRAGTITADAITDALDRVKDVGATVDAVLDVKEGTARGSGPNAV